METLLLTHYYSEEFEPMHSIIDCDERQRQVIVKQLSANPNKSYGRFRNFEWYIKNRMETEKWLYQEFIKLGGIPKLISPLYFILGSSNYLESCYGSQVKKIQVSIDIINECDISFTLTDSMAMYLSKDIKRVLTEKMLFELLGNNHNDLMEYIKNIDSEHKYIEAQVWNNEYFIK